MVSKPIRSTSYVLSRISRPQRLHLSLSVDYSNIQFIFVSVYPMLFSSVTYTTVKTKLSNYIYTMRMSFDNNVPHSLSLIYQRFKFFIYNYREITFYNKLNQSPRGSYDILGFITTYVLPYQTLF